MKKLLLLLAVTVSLSIFSTGCATGSKLSPYQRATNVVETVVEIPATTNIVERPAVTNSAGEIVEPAVSVEVITPARLLTNFSTNIVVNPNPKWIGSIETIKTINSSVNPTPSAPIINGVLGLLAAGLAWWGRVATVRANKKQTMLETVITGVEKANSQEVKDAISVAATQYGIYKELRAEVKKQTE